MNYSNLQTQGHTLTHYKTTMANDIYVTQTFFSSSPTHLGVFNLIPNNSLYDLQRLINKPILNIHTDVTYPTYRGLSIPDSCIPYAVIQTSFGDLICRDITITPRYTLKSVCFAYTESNLILFHIYDKVAQDTTVYQFSTLNTKAEVANLISNFAPDMDIVLEPTLSNLCVHTHTLQLGGYLYRLRPTGQGDAPAGASTGKAPCEEQDWTGQGWTQIENFKEMQKQVKSLQDSLKFMTTERDRYAEKFKVATACAEALQRHVDTLNKTTADEIKEFSAKLISLETIIDAPPASMSTPIGLLTIDSKGMRELVDYTANLISRMKAIDNLSKTIGNLSSHPSKPEEKTETRLSITITK